MQFRTAAITFGASGDNNCVAAVAGSPIKVWKIWFTAAGAVNVTFKDGASTSLSGAAILSGAGSSFFAVYDASPWWVTSPGNAFVINLSGAVALAGEVYYTLG